MRGATARGKLAEVSRFSYRARSLLCKHKIGRQTAPCGDAGDRARHTVDFRATDAAGSAAVTCPRAAVARAKMSRSCCRIRASGWTRRCLFRMVFKYSPFGEPRSHAGFANRGTRICLSPCRATIVSLCFHNSKLGRVLFEPTALSD